ncbi:MAG TPA: vWA domain-containing protein [Polyangiaceae bacterium]|nr:vWA domain-containing protein [Polyangiaceae bacterium]
MNWRSQGPSKTALFGAAALSLLLGSFVVPGCKGSSDESLVNPCDSLTCGSACSAAAPCGSGLYCAANNLCTADCTPATGNCGAGQSCSSSGKCVVGGVIDPRIDAGDPDDVPDGCIKDAVKVSSPTPTVIMLIDQSGSMNEGFGNGNRWNVLRDALIDKSTGIISTLESKVRFGLALYTSQNGFGSGMPANVCPMINAVPPALNNYADITAKYLPNDWKGDTPTGESIDAAVKILDAVTEPGPKVIVLATDGEPDSCADPNPGSDQGIEAARTLSVTAVQNAFKKQIATHVISVGDDVGQEHLRAVANAGQGLAVDIDQADRFYLANDQADLATAFDTIVSGVRSCVFTLNGAVADGRADTGAVLLDGKFLIYMDKDGWRLNSPSVLELQGAACAALKKSGDHDLKIDFPCGDFIPTIPK